MRKNGAEAGKGPIICFMFVKRRQVTFEDAEDAKKCNPRA